MPEKNTARPAVLLDVSIASLDRRAAAAAPIRKRVTMNSE